jgi:prolyl oligopeptidase PreP (S9A serine peptidase family)
MPEPDSREPWFVCEAHAQGDLVDRVVTAFAESFRAALEARAHGTALADEAEAAHGAAASPTAG